MSLASALRNRKIKMPSNNALVGKSFASEFFMLKVYDRVVSTGNKSTLLMLTLIFAVLFMTMTALEWVRSQILVKVSSRLEILLN